MYIISITYYIPNIENYKYIYGATDKMGERERER